MNNDVTNYRRNSLGRKRNWSKDRKAVIQAVRQSNLHAQANIQTQVNSQAQDLSLDNDHVYSMETDEETGGTATHMYAAASNNPSPDEPAQAADMQADATVTLSVVATRRV